MDNIIEFQLIPEYKNTYWWPKEPSLRQKLEISKESDEKTVAEPIPTVDPKEIELQRRIENLELMKIRLQQLSKMGNDDCILKFDSYLDSMAEDWKFVFVKNKHRVEKGSTLDKLYKDLKFYTFIIKRKLSLSQVSEIQVESQSKHKKKKKKPESKKKEASTPAVSSPNDLPVIEDVKEGITKFHLMICQSDLTLDSLVEVRKEILAVYSKLNKYKQFYDESADVPLVLTQLDDCLSKINEKIKKLQKREEYLEESLDNTREMLASHFHDNEINDNKARTSVIQFTSEDTISIGDLLKQKGDN